MIFLTEHHPILIKLINLESTTMTFTRTETIIRKMVLGVRASKFASLAKNL